MKTRVLAALATATAAVALGAVVPGVAHASTVGGGIRTWSPLSEDEAYNGTVSRAKAISIAKAFDVVTAHRDTFKGSVAAMKQANPRLKILVYTNAMFAQEGQGQVFPPSFYSYDSSGRKVRTTGFGNYMMNPLSIDGGQSGESWANERFRQCRNAIEEAGYDGCFLDVLGTAPLQKGYVTSPPLNPNTKRPWAQKDYLAATSALAKTIDTLLVADGHSGLVLYGNGLGSGPRFYGGARVLLPSLDAGIAEAWLRPGPSSLTSWPTTAAWKQNVDMLSAGQIYVSVKTFATGTAAQKTQWHKYALASFLLGADSRDGFSFLSSPTQDYSVPSPWWSTRLGAPKGHYVKAGTAYVRTYASGKAVVNPGTTPVTVPLGRTYCGLTGFKGTSLKLAAHSGEVLRTC